MYQTGYAPQFIIELGVRAHTYASEVLDQESEIF